MKVFEEMERSEQKKKPKALKVGVLWEEGPINPLETAQILIRHVRITKVVEAMLRTGTRAMKILV